MGIRRRLTQDGYFHEVEIEHFAFEIDRSMAQSSDANDDGENVPRQTEQAANDGHHLPKDREKIVEVHCARQQATGLEIMTNMKSRRGNLRWHCEKNRKENLMTDLTSLSRIKRMRQDCVFL